MSDPGTSYRTRDEIQEVRATRDPITSLKDKILSNNLGTAEELKVTFSFFLTISFSIITNLYFAQEMEIKLRNMVDEAMKKSKTDKEIPVSELAADIYADPKNSEVVRNVLPTPSLVHSTIGKAINI